MYITRIAKIVMVASLAVYCLLVAFGNVTDYQSNFLFVKHVMSMDTTFPGNKLMYRAVTDPTLWHAAYALIIFGEALAGVLLLAGAIRLWQVRARPHEVFNGAKALAVAGALVAFLVWFFGFVVIAGEWFAMWQSQTWDGENAAFRISMTVLAVLIFVVLPDGDLETAALAKPPAKTPAKPSAEPAPKSAAKASPKRSRGAAKKAPVKKAPAKKAATKKPSKKRSRAKTSAAASKAAAAADNVREES